jgi:DNA-directed RNA polymerase specialized sigma24 family protein
VFVLRHLEQRSLDEIARTLSSNANACKQAIFRAVRKLRAHLAHFEGATHEPDDALNPATTNW